MTNKQYSKPRVIKLGDAIETTLGASRGFLRDFRWRYLIQPWRA